LETIEEYRDLSLAEWNFREILKEKNDLFVPSVEDLLETKRKSQMG